MDTASLVDLFIGSQGRKDCVCVGSALLAWTWVDGTGHGPRVVTCQMLLLLTTEHPISLYSLLVTHMSLNEDSEHRMEPPTQAPYLA